MTSQADLEQLRSDFKLVSEWWAKACGWTLGEIQVAGDLVRDAVERKAADELIAWAAWLAMYAGELRRTGERLRAFEQSVRQEAEAARRKVA